MQQSADQRLPIAIAIPVPVLFQNGNGPGWWQGQGQPRTHEFHTVLPAVQAASSAHDGPGFRFVLGGTQKHTERERGATTATTYNATTCTRERVRQSIHTRTREPSEFLAIATMVSHRIPTCSLYRHPSRKSSDGMQDVVYAAKYRLPYMNSCTVPMVAAHR